MSGIRADARDASRLSADLHRLDHVSRAAMAAVLHPALPGTADGIAARLPVAPRHRSLLRRWLASLTAAGAVRRDEDGVFHAVGPADPPALHELPDRYGRLGFPPAMARLHRAALERLPELLSDRVTLAGLLPQDTDVLTALGAYQRNVFTGRLHARCAELAAGAVAARGHGPARVVEIGGGSAATAQAVLEALRGHDADYVFTDVSPLCTAAAAERFGVATALLDVDGDFAAQGFPPGSADVVVAANVLHNAADIPAALRRVRRLLAPGGTLLVIDSAGDCDTVLTSMEFLLSPPASSPHAADPRTRCTDRRAGTDTVFPAAGEWEEDLTAAGLLVRARYPDEADGPAPAGQYLWHAVAPGEGAVDTSALQAILAGRDGEAVCTVDGSPFDARAVLAAVPPTPAGRLPEEAALFFSGVAEALAAAQPEPGPEPGPPPHTLVLTGDPAGAEAALHTWARRGRVTAVPSGTPPARLLAALERAQATEAVLPPALVRSLPESPTAALTDLSALARVVCTEPGADPESAAAWAALGPRLVQAAPPRPGGHRATRDIAETASAAGDAALGGLDPHASAAAAREVSRAALHSMLHTLRQAGCCTRTGERRTRDEITAAVRPAPAHRRLLHRWLTVLTEEGLLSADASGALRCTADPDTYADLDAVWGPARQRWRAAHGSDATVTYARSSAGELLALLRGERSAAGLLFPRGRTDTARSLYRESATARYQHHAAAALTAGHLRETDSGRVRRVLEAGGGTATTTEVVLPALERLTGTPVEYLFTDVSPFFLDHARDRFGDRLRYGLLDIDRDPVEQGHAAGTFDAVVAGGVLNAAVDTDRSVRGLTRLLVPGGLLVLTEPTREEHWVLASQGFLLADPGDARAATGASFLTHDQWRAVLDEAGLLPVADLPAAGHPLHPLGHRVFAARRPAT
ncbi:class I SAM-dependent methyltransferase [Streptomyces albus]|uniref:class I SAM-dependent methyltransferase n=1 Tax=Streptomyces sp. NRRL F-5917 TaxID=1463873 RepID=UPI00068F850F|nr:class I SAM-dependent methyltransferase [Streptomyces sp. NRRL F-5917]